MLMSHRSNVHNIQNIWYCGYDCPALHHVSEAVCSADFLFLLEQQALKIYHLDERPVVLSSLFIIFLLNIGRYLWYIFTMARLDWFIQPLICTSKLHLKPLTKPVSSYMEAWFYFFFLSHSIRNRGYVHRLPLSIWYRSGRAKTLELEQCWTLTGYRKKEFGVYDLLLEPLLVWRPMNIKKQWDLCHWNQEYA